MARLPTNGSDQGTWGTILNDFLLVEHNNDGSLKTSGSLSNKADESTVVHLASTETITGTKIFSVSPEVPTPTSSAQATSKSYVDTTVTNSATPNATASTPGKIQLAGDISGSATAPTVPGLTQKVDKSLMVAKGDIYVATGASAPSKLSTGSDGQFLQAASGASTGLQWNGIEDPCAAMHGLNMLTMHPAIAITSHSLASGTVVFNLIRSTKPQQITTLGVWMHGAGSGPNGVNGMALYTEAGVFIAKTNSIDFSVAGYVEGTLTSPQILSVGTYYIGVLTHNTSVPAIQSSNLNANLPAFTTHYPSIAFTGLTDFAASFTPSTAPANNSSYVMGAR